MPSRRQRMIQLLEEQPFTVKSLAAELQMRVADVVDDLKHVQRTLGRRLHVTPSTCEACGFVVDRAGRFTAPSRCPRCRSERTTEPLLSVAREQG